MSFEPLKLCLVSDAEAVNAAVRVSCPPPHTVGIFSLNNLLDAEQGISEHGQTLLDSASSADAVLVHWYAEQAQVIGTLCYHVHLKVPVPVIALCTCGQGEEAQAFAAGVDDGIIFPLYLPLLQAKIAAFRRTLEAVPPVEGGSKMTLEEAEAYRHIMKAVRRDVTKTVKTKILRKRDVWVEEEWSNGVAVANGMTGAGTVEGTEELTEAIVHDVVEALTTNDIPGPAPTDESHETRSSGVLRIDRTAHRVYVHDEEIELTPKEYDLLDYFMAHEGALCTRDQILNNVWDIGFETGTNIIDVYMHYLRRRLEDHGLEGVIRTVRGRGYRFSLPAPEAPEEDAI